MLLFTGNGNSRLPVWVPPIQAYVDTEDVLKAMSKHIQVTGLIDNMFIEFENTKIPICSQHECRIIAQMVAAYHNACLATTLSSQTDLYGKAYTPENTLLNEDKLFWMKADNLKQTRQSNTKRKLNENTKKNPRERNNSHRMSNKTDTDHESSWDEEIHGDRLVFDANYEMNENLVPWLMRPNEWEDKYGCY
jgi:hypothetical protein